jgi:hypothetical protein
MSTANPGLAAVPRVERARAAGLSTAQTVRGMLVVGWFVCGALMVMQDDSWWHLRTGQIIWQTGGVPTTDPFSFTLPAGTYWPNHEWLAQVILYAAFWLGGLPLLNLLGGCVIAGAGLLLYSAMTGGFQRRFALTCLALPWIVSALSVRPQIFTLLAMSLTLWLLARERHRWLPLVFLVWANLHGAVCLGGLVMLGASIAALLFDRRRFAHLALTTAACGAATLCTPMGWKLLLFPLESVHRLKQIGLTEWAAPGFSQWEHVYFWFLLASFAILIAARWRTAAPWPDRMLVLVAALLGCMAVLSARNVPLFVIAASVAGSRLFSLSYDRHPEYDFSRRNTFILGAFAALASTGLALAFALPLERLAWRPMPPAALAAIRACPAPLFNTYNAGGYMLWFTPERPVFADSRQDPYPLDFLVELARVQRTGDYGDFFARHGIRSAFLETKWPLAGRLLTDGWRATYRDREWIVLERQPPTP